MKFNMRTVQLVGTSRYVSVPQELFEKGDVVRVDVLDDKSVKITKVE